MPPQPEANEHSQSFDYSLPPAESGEPHGLPKRFRPTAFTGNQAGSGIVPIGLNIWQPDDQAAKAAALEGLKTGYRILDTAAVYANEKGVGLAIREAMDSLNLQRPEIFVSAKLWNNSHGYDMALKACEFSLERLGLDWLDMYQIHWPAPSRELYLETWEALVRLKAEGLVKSIGVSNFLPEHIDKLIEATGEKPVLNQIEIHPHFQQYDLCRAMERRGIKVEAWAPLGGSSGLSDPVFLKLAHKYGKTPAQVVLRWHLDSGRTAIPKSTMPSRIKENFNIFDFSLDQEDMRQIALLDCGRRMGPDPLSFN